MLYLLIFSFAMGLILKTTHFPDRMRSLKINRYLMKLVYKRSVIGLGNRLAFINMIKDMLQHATALPRYFILIDIDSAKRISDLHGHGIGKEVWRGVAQGIMQVAKTCIHGCLGGKQFGVIAREIHVQTEQSRFRHRFILCQSAHCQSPGDCESWNHRKPRHHEDQPMDKCS